MYPYQRNRRLRQSQAVRALVSENHLTVNDLMFPLFATEGTNVKEPITAMPGCHRFSLDLLKEELKVISDLGIKAVLLFVKVEDALKDNKGTEALNPAGLMQRAVQTIKANVPEIVVMTDVALDPYSSFGHDGIVEKGKITNDTTVEVLSQIALSHALAGADFVAPSDMMDGRILSIRIPDLENILSANGIKIQPIEVYDTQLKNQRVKGHFDGILFFSPSGVRGYAQSNGFENTHSFCLGPSTAKEVALYTDDYTVAKEPNESQLLLSLKNHITLHEE